MPSKPTELLPLGAAPSGTDLLHVAQWDGAKFDSRQVTAAEFAGYAASANLPLLGVDAVAGTTYTFLATDNYRHKRFTSADPVAAIVPTNAAHAIPVGTRIRVTQAGAGQVIYTPAGGVTLNSRGGALKSTAQFAVSEIEKVGTDEWDVLGDVTA